MSRISHILLNNTGDDPTAVGTAVRCDAWHYGGERLFTVAAHVSNYVGAVVIEASLAENPTSNDWFEVTKFVFEPEGLGGFIGVSGKSFRGNYVWLRASMQRPVNENIVIIGHIDRVLLNF